MPFPYKKVLVVGATSGIGEALASAISAAGAHVIVTGRRKERLDAFVSQHGADKATAAVLDLNQLSSIPQFAADVLAGHPDLDSVFLNSGLQHVFDFSKPDSVDLSKLENEVQTNYVSYMHLLKAFLPHLQKQEDKETSLIFTSSGLALVPLVRCPNYCATKAALHHFVLSLREQMKSGPGNVKVIEIFPPAVQTELHDYMEGGRQLGMPLNEFTEAAWKGLDEGLEEIPVGMSKMAYDAFENTRQGIFKKMNQLGPQ